MDNTLLRSRIDFVGMREETYRFLMGQGLLPRNTVHTAHTTSTLIAEAMNRQQMTDDLLEQMWAIPKKYEVMGMKDAELEPGVRETLEQLSGRYRLAVVTNNAQEAAEAALKDNDVLYFFEVVVGRERMKRMKPSPDGFMVVLQKYKDTQAVDWISVGDSWIDGRASAEAGIPFIAYQGDRSKLEDNAVYPIAELADLRELLSFL